MNIYFIAMNNKTEVVIKFSSADELSAFMRGRYYSQWSLFCKFKEEDPEISNLERQAKVLSVLLNKSYLSNPT